MSSGVSFLSLPALESICALLPPRCRPGAAVVGQQGVRGTDGHREAVPQGSVYRPSISQLRPLLSGPAGHDQDQGELMAAAAVSPQSYTYAPPTLDNLFAPTSWRQKAAKGFNVGQSEQTA